MKTKINLTLHQRTYCARVCMRILENYRPDTALIAANNSELLRHQFMVSACELALIDWKLARPSDTKISLLHSQICALYLITNSENALKELTEPELFTAREVNYVLFMEIVNFNFNKL